MATFNRILIAIIALLAIAAAIMSYLLFERRNEFRDRASTLAESVVAMVRSLDTDSGTGLARQVTFSPADDVAPESGTLSWQAYNENPQNVERLLSRAENLADAVTTQRNFLATNIEQVAFTLGMPVEDLNVQQLTHVDDVNAYQSAAQQVIRLSRAVNTRSEDMIRNIVDTSNILDPQLLNEQNFRERIQDIDEDGRTIYRGFRHENELDRFKNAVTALHRRTNDYARAISSGIEMLTAWDWDTSADRVRDPATYTQALVSLSNDFQELNQRLVQAEQERVKLQQTEAQLAETRDDLRRATEARDNLQVQVNRLETQVENLERQVGTGVVRAPRDPGEPPRIRPDLEGRVLHVNDDYRFVILDLGRQDIPENTELLVARGQELVGRILVTRVTARISVAEILPSPQLTLQVQENDRVIPPMPL